MKKILSLILTVVMLLTFIPMVYAEDDIKKVGDIIEFGEYPQKEVTDKALISKLDKLAPAWESWKSYDYYSGEGKYGTMTAGSWMRYAEVSYNGSKYRGVRFTQCRAAFTYGSSVLSCNDNGYCVDTNYWFKYEPLKWRVLDPTTGLVMCETVIDSQPYSNTIYFSENAASDTYAYFSDDNFQNYASDYETSSIRKWLNSDFYNTAFASGEKSKIISTALNNDGYYTINGKGNYSALDSKETNDNVFLLSYDQVTNSLYGFSEIADTSGKARRAQGSDYAKCQGLWVSEDYCEGNSYWLLRTAGVNSDSACYVNVDGKVSYSYSVSRTVFGVRPALCLGSIIHKHEYTAVKTWPTCTDGGFTTYTCYCGYSYISDYVGSVDHKDENGDNRCDFACRYEFKDSESNGSESNESQEKTLYEKLVEWFKELFNKILGWIKN